MGGMTQHMKAVREIVGDTQKYVDTIEVLQATGGAVAFSLQEETIPLGGREGYKLQTVCRALTHDQTRELFNVLKDVLEDYDETA